MRLATIALFVRETNRAADMKGLLRQATSVTVWTAQTYKLPQTGQQVSTHATIT